MQGFARFVQTGVRVGDRPLKLDVKLDIEQQVTSVTVTTDVSQISADPDSNASSVAIRGRELDALAEEDGNDSAPLNSFARRRN
jgi:hypothetical protein